VLLCLASVKGSPGVTTLAVALAACWPQPWQRLLVEADPAGGDLAARFGLPATPGLVSLAAAARRSTGPHLTWEHAQPLSGGLTVVLGPTRPDQAHAALATICGADGRAGVLGSFAGRDDMVVVADCGRLDPSSPAFPVAQAADQLLLVTRPRVDELAHAAAWADAWSGSVAARTRLLLVGAGYPAGEVSREVGVPVLASLPVDARAAAALSGHGSVRRRHRAPLLRAATALAAELSLDPRRVGRTDASGERPPTAHEAAVGLHSAAPADVTSGGGGR
jgi:hypothetical protein